MIKMKNTEVFGWEAAIRGMRNPMNSWEKSDTFFFEGTYLQDGKIKPLYINWRGESPSDGSFTGPVIIGEADHKLMMNLAKAGSVDAKYRRMIVATVDITAPLYWWKEFDTYKIGTVANSCSTMHKIQAKEFDLSDFSCEHLFRCPTIETDMPDFYGEATADFEKWREANDPNLPVPRNGAEREIDWHYEHGAFHSEEDWNEFDSWVNAEYAEDALRHTIWALNYYREQFLETKDKRYWWQMIQLLPSSYNQRRTVMLNYEVLAGIYPKRKDHKLDEWHNFCSWIKSLPYSEIITLEEKDDK